MNVEEIKHTKIFKTTSAQYASKAFICHAGSAFTKYFKHSIQDLEYMNIS